MTSPLPKIPDNDFEGRLLDCGVSGGDVVQRAGWDELSLESPWDEVLEVLRPGPDPRPAQIKALGKYRILESRRNLIVSAPTSGGKSLIGLLVMIDAVRRGGRAVLLEPLRAVAREKAEELQAFAPRIEEVLGTPLRVRISTGDYISGGETLFDAPPAAGEIIVATPERFETFLRDPECEQWLNSVEAVCVDEAHLIGSAHRGPTIEYIITRLLCLSATPRLVLLSATMGDVERVREWLSPCDAVVVRDRQPPLHKQIVALDHGADADETVIALVRETLRDSDSSVLVFVYQTRSAERLANNLRETLDGRDGSAGSLAYHARMGVMERESVRRDFGSGRSRCVVSTTALGLGVNLPATHVIVRDVYFPGVGSLSVADLLQMMGRAGRGNRVGRAVAVVRQGDPRDASELQRKLSEESLPELVSHFERPAAHRSRKESAANVTIVATHVASYLSHRREMRGTVEELTEFFGRSLGGRELVRCVPAALQWLTDPARVLAYQDEGGRYALTTLGRNAVKATLPLDLASGFAQLIRDLLSLDPSDRLLAGWQPLDHLIVLELLFQRTPELRRFSEILARQLDRDNHLRTSLLHREWISGSFDHSRAAEVLGSLGIQPPTPVTNDAWARKRAYSAVFRATLLFERMNGTPISEVGERWKVSGLGGVEERWRDDFSWLLSAVAEMLDLRCFYFHLREECGSDPERSMRVKRILLHMRTQTFDLRKCLGYCSPLGPVLRALRTNRPGTARSRSVGIRSIRKLEDAGIRNLEDLEALEVDDLIRLGVHGDLAEQIHSYTSGLLRDKLMPNASDHTATKA